MLRSGIGKCHPAGYTLLEVLAVLILIGFTILLVVPNIFLKDEELEIRSVRNLLNTDLKQMKLEAELNRDQAKIEFNKAGYRLTLGEKQVERTFPRYQLVFALPEAPQDQSGQPAEQDVVKMPEVQFLTDGSCTALAVNWQTIHYKGTLTVTSDGTMQWNYQKK
jgi:type II secretory pathway pseudopilin PulG